MRIVDMRLNVEWYHANYIYDLNLCDKFAMQNIIKSLKNYMCINNCSNHVKLNIKIAMKLLS